MVFTGVTDSRSLCRDKLHFSQNVFAASTSTMLCGATRCATARSGPTKPVGQQDESSIGFQRRNDLQDTPHSDLQNHWGNHSHVGREESCQGEELGAILQPGSSHAGRA